MKFWDLEGWEKDLVMWWPNNHQKVGSLFRKVGFFPISQKAFCSMESDL
jgi:hypothetical protein